MNVYLLMVGEYEDEERLGVFGSLDSAKAAADSHLIHIGALRLVAGLDNRVTWRGDWLEKDYGTCREYRLGNSAMDYWYRILAFEVNRREWEVQ